MNVGKWFGKHSPKLAGLEILKYIGPGCIVAVGFIDPGNWAANIAAGSRYGYSLPWMVSLSTLMLIILQLPVLVCSFFCALLSLWTKGKMIGTALIFRMRGDR